MRNWFVHFLILGFILLQSMPSMSQGCSDAGFCTMGAMRPNQHFIKKANVALKSIELTEYVGITKFSDIYFSTIMDVNIGVNPKTSFQVKLPYTIVIAPFGKRSGLGDISLSATRNVWATEKQQINLTVGLKLPTGDANAKDEDGKSLPMYYQTTLGTYDLVVGLSWITRGWLIAAGYQQALNQVNNEFNWGLWKGDPDSIAVAKYPVSNGLIRGKDVMMRVEKNFRFGRFNTYVGLLPIYRFTKDKVISKGQLIEAEGSDGLALTLLIGAGYRLSYHSGIKILAGFRILERKINPDGLSREQVFTVGYEYRF
ncbi:MAG: transporter [Cytophagales bacterium]|nr:transporter [Cytophagales bacterium]